jgi:ABC-type nitrate/sulfonate/bicarbonate transport system substrate-binding protein
MSSLVPFTFYLDWIFCAQFAGLCWAKDKGLYADAGLDVHLVPWGEGVAASEGSAAASLSGSSSIGARAGEPASASAGISVCGSSLDAMGGLIVGAENDSVIDMVLRSTADGRLSAGSCEDNLVVSRAAEDGSVKVFGAMLQATPLVLMSLPEKRIRSLVDLRGKRIGMHADGIRVLEMLLKLEGIPLADVGIEEVGFDLAHLPEGRFDAQQGYTMTEPVQLQAMGIHVDLLTLQSPQLQPYAQTYFAPSTALETDREVFRAFLAASTAGWKAICTEPDEAARIVARMMGDPSLADPQRRMLDRVIPLVAGRLSDDYIGTIQTPQWTRNLDSYVRTGLLDRPLQLGGVVTVV